MLAELICGKKRNLKFNGIDSKYSYLIFRFPHHENEEAQSCVYHKVDDWVTNWIHTGHLHLPGQKDKMSKSLKNTVSIREMLEKYSANQFRIACLLSHYRSSIEFGTALLTSSETILKKIHSFTSDCEAFIQGIKPNTPFDENLLAEKMRKCREDVDVALKDDFNTGASVGSIQELMSMVNKIVSNPIKTESTYETNSNLSLVQSAVNYVTQMFTMFGVKLSTNESVETVSNHHLIDDIIEVRNEIRLKAKETKNKELFKVCDDIRTALDKNCVEVKDHGNLSSWKFKE